MPPAVRADGVEELVEAELGGEVDFLELGEVGLRLGFAVAAHLECEILAVDEVLAVGDASFQKRCIGRMSEAASAGKTVLFVSHNMQSVEQLCTRACVIERGQLAQATKDHCLRLAGGGAGRG